MFVIYAFHVISFKSGFKDSFYYFQISTRSKYFKSWMAWENMKSEPKEMPIINFPNVASTGQCSRYINLIPKPCPILPELIKYLHVKLIIVLSAYFAVDMVFTELITLDASIVDVDLYKPSVFPTILSYLTEQLGFNTVITQTYYEKALHIMNIPRHVIEIYAWFPERIKIYELRKIVRDYCRKEIFRRNIEILKCAICRQTFCNRRDREINYIRTPCCYSVVQNNECMLSIIIEKEYNYKCSICGTNYKNFRPYSFMESRRVTTQRQVLRQRNGASPSIIRFESLPENIFPYDGFFF